MSFMDRERERKGKGDEERKFADRVAQAAERLAINWRVNYQPHAPQSSPPKDPTKPGPGQVLSARGFVELYHGPIDRNNVPREMLRRPRYCET